MEHYGMENNEVERYEEVECVEEEQDERMVHGAMLEQFDALAQEVVDDEEEQDERMVNGDMMDQFDAPEQEFDYDEEDLKLYEGPRRAPEQDADDDELNFQERHHAFPEQDFVVDVEDLDFNDYQHAVLDQELDAQEEMLDLHMEKLGAPEQDFVLQNAMEDESRAPEQFFADGEELDYHEFQHAVLDQELNAQEEMLDLHKEQPDENESDAQETVKKPMKREKARKTAEEDAKPMDQQVAEFKKMLKGCNKAVKTMGNTYEELKKKNKKLAADLVVTNLRYFRLADHVRQLGLPMTPEVARAVADCEASPGIVEAARKTFLNGPPTWIVGDAASSSTTCEPSTSGAQNGGGIDEDGEGYDPHHGEDQNVNGNDGEPSIKRAKLN